MEVILGSPSPGETHRHEHSLTDLEVEAEFIDHHPEAIAKSTDANLHDHMAMEESLHEAYQIDRTPSYDKRRRLSGMGMLVGMLEAKNVAGMMKRNVLSHDKKVRSRSTNGQITAHGYERVKDLACSSKKLPKKEGYFTPHGRAYVPIGGTVITEKKKLKEKREPKVEEKTVAAKKSEREKLLASPVIPLDDPSGYRLELPSYGETLIQVRLTDVKDEFHGKKVKVPRSLTIVMTEITGNPDLYIVPDHHLHKLPLGVPTKEHNVWKTKTRLQILPTHPKFTSGIYYMRISCGVDASSTRIIAFTERYTPTITKAIQGAGHGYRPSEKNKREEIGNMVIIKGIANAEHRRKLGIVGHFSMSSLPMPSYMKKDNLHDDSSTLKSNSKFDRMSSASPMGRPNGKGYAPVTNVADLASPRSPSKSSIGYEASRQRPKSAMSGTDSERQGARSSVSGTSYSGFQRAMTRTSLTWDADSSREESRVARPQSALERAVDVSFKSALHRVKYDKKRKDLREVRVQDFFAVLQPAKMQFSHVNQTAKQLGLLFGASDADLRTEDIPLPIPTGAAAAENKDSAEPAKSPISRSPYRNRNREIGFKDHLNALFKQHDPISKRMKDYEYVQLIVPIAQVTGYAVVSGDGPGTRKLIFRDTSSGKKRKGMGNEIRSGYAMHVHCGAVVPDGADAVVKDRHAMKVKKQNALVLEDRAPAVVVSDLATPGQNIKCEERPYYVGGGIYVPAKDYVHVRYPHALGEYEALFKLHFKEPVDPEHGKQQNSDTALKEEVVTEILAGIDSSPSKLLQGLKAAERKRVAEGSRLQIIHARTALMEEQDHEDNVGETARSMWLLLSGQMGVYKHYEEDFDEELVEIEESGSAGFEEEDECGQLLGTEARTGAIFGERQLLFGDEWPCSLKGITACKVAEIPLSALAPVILARPDALEGLEWNSLEEGFSRSQNHSELLGMIKGLSSPVRTPKSRTAEGQAEEMEELRQMLQLHPKDFKQLEEVETERRLIESLISLGALSEEQIAIVHSDTKLFPKPEETQEERNTKQPNRRGAKGDSVTQIMEPEVTEMAPPNSRVPSMET